MRPKAERIEIGRQIYEKELTRAEAMVKYGISHNTVDHYLKLYRESKGIPTEFNARKPKSISVLQEGMDIGKYREMSREELIDELIKAKANELRAKKGYEVKGDGANKEYISLNNRNSKS